MPKQAIIIFGPPGSGKGTQAELLERRFDFIHFDTGRYLENLLYAPGAMKSAVLRRERKNFDTGKLCTDSWVLKVMREVVRRVAQAGYSVVFSGAPRTLSQAFGDLPAQAGKRATGLIGTLERYYGKKNVKAVFLKIAPRVSLARNRIRKVCTVCGLPRMGRNPSPSCLFCGGPLRTRSLDNPKVIRERLKEYRGRTTPLLARLRREGFRVATLNGVPAPYKVFQKLAQAVGLRLQKTR